MIQGAATAGLWPEQPLLARLDTVIETATTAFFDALDTSEKPTTWLHLQKATQAADDSWLPTNVGTHPTVPEIEQSGLASKHDDDDSEPTFEKKRLSAPQLQAQLSRLSDRTRLRRFKHNSAHQRCMTAITSIEALCHTQLSHNWLGNGAYTGRQCGLFQESQLEHGETCSTTEANRGHNACVHAVLGGLKLADTGITTEPRGLKETQPKPADLVTLDVCVASSNAAAARRDAAQATFDRKTSQNRR